MNDPFKEPNLTEEKVIEIIKNYLKLPAFTDRKLTDTPTDNFEVVNRKYVNLYGSVVSAPSSSVIGQQFFATDLGYPIFKNTNYRWANSVGSVVG